MKVIKDGAYFFLSKLLFALSQLLLIMVLSRQLSLNDYGTFQQIIVVITLTPAVLSLGIPFGITFFYKKDDKNINQKIITNSIVILFVIGLITQLLLIIYPYTLGILFNNNSLNSLAWLIGLYSFSRLMYSPIDNLYVASGLSKLLMRLNILYYVIYSLSIVIYLNCFELSLQGILLLIVCLELLKALSYYIVYFLRYKYKLQWDINFLSKFLLYSFPIGIASIAEILNQSVDKFLISLYYDPASFAIFNNAAAEVPFIGLITGTVLTVMLPILSQKFNQENKPNEALNLWKDSSEVVALFIFPLFFVLMVYSHEYITLLYSDKYIESISIFIIFLLRFPVKIVIFGALLNITGNQKFVLQNTLTVLIINFVLDIILINIFGMHGAAVATVLSYFIGVYLQIKKISQVFQVSMRAILPFKKILTIYCITGIISIPILYVVSIISELALLRLSLSTICITMMLILICGKFNLIKFNLKDLFLKKVKRRAV